MPRDPREALRRLRGRGVRQALAYLRHVISEEWNEARLGVRTAGRERVAAADLHTTPIAYRAFRAAMARVRVKAGEGVFLDIGAGKGRAVVLAATYPFQRVIGVEKWPEMAALARENVERARRRLICRQVEVVTADVASYPVPDQVTLVHLFNPFGSPLLEATLAAIRASLDRTPRPLTLLFANPYRFEPIAAATSWLERRGDVPYPYVESDLPDRSRYRIWEARR